MTICDLAIPRDDITPLAVSITIAQSNSCHAWMAFCSRSALIVAAAALTSPAVSAGSGYSRPGSVLEVMHLLCA